jgi:hypothetical protein
MNVEASSNWAKDSNEAGAAGFIGRALDGTVNERVGTLSFEQDGVAAVTSDCEAKV